MNNITKTAVVTGAGSGIGRAVAQILLENGYNVVLTGRREGNLQQTVDESPTNASSALCIAADVSIDTDVDTVFDSALERFGRIDVLFNNAGTGRPSTDIDELSVEDWRSVIDVNITGSFLCARRAFGIMRRQQPMGGRIINNGSISAHLPRPGTVPYTVSKHAITGLTKCLALDGRPYDIACGQIDIGNAHTDMAAPLAEGALQANGSIAPEPLMDVGHVATSVLHMANLPLTANVLFMNVMATKMPFVGRG